MKMCITISTNRFNTEWKYLLSVKTLIILIHLVQQLNTQQTPTTHQVAYCMQKVNHNLIPINAKSGTMCAKDYYEASCFYSGDSGSPLMMRFVFKVYIIKLYFPS